TVGQLTPGRAAPAVAGWLSGPENHRSAARGYGGRAASVRLTGHSRMGAIRTAEHGPAGAIRPAQWPVNRGTDSAARHVHSAAPLPADRAARPASHNPVNDRCHHGI